ncbi:hypothetical protein SLEP1_g6473 [Rubroshorea leprosula]|uniref:Uncharacterized protein n=1 Tax=Rubroshorea leprosula TaxID=152421 RepID=A0AAV5I5A1_9ROSI|nr:hypothetical protein SLEP1_g6473 [Rubroshorea leprosula]
MSSGNKPPRATTKDVGAMMSCIWLIEDIDDILLLHEVWQHGDHMGKFFLVSKVELENLWCLHNIDELDVSFSDSSHPLFKEKDKDVEGEEDGMGLAEKGDRLIHGLVNGALDTLGMDTVLKVPLS